MKRSCIAIVAGLAVATIAAGTVSAGSVYEWTWDGSFHGWQNIETRYNQGTQELYWSSTFVPGLNPDAYTLVMSDGRNPNGRPGEFAQFFVEEVDRAVDDDDALGAVAAVGQRLGEALDDLARHGAIGERADGASPSHDVPEAAGGQAEQGPVLDRGRVGQVHQRRRGQMGDVADLGHQLVVHAGR